MNINRDKETIAQSLRHIFPDRWLCLRIKRVVFHLCGQKTYTIADYMEIR